jgi:hypothetical protein
MPFALLTEQPLCRSQCGGTRHPSWICP